MKRLVLLTGAGLLLLSAGLAEAQSGNRWFDKIDEDGDGAISHEEAAAFRERRFARMDLDGDGNITRQEFAERGEERFAKADADGDGRITKAEMEEAKKRWRSNNN